MKRRPAGARLTILTEWTMISKNTTLRKVLLTFQRPSILLYHTSAALTIISRRAVPGYKSHERIYSRRAASCTFPVPLHMHTPHTSSAQPGP